MARRSCFARSRRRSSLRASCSATSSAAAAATATRSSGSPGGCATTCSRASSASSGHATSTASPSMARIDDDSLEVDSEETARLRGAMSRFPTSRLDGERCVVTRARAPGSVRAAPRRWRRQARRSCSSGRDAGRCARACAARAARRTSCGRPHRRRRAATASSGRRSTRSARSTSLVHTAGIFEPRPFLEAPLETLDVSGRQRAGTLRALPGRRCRTCARVARRLHLVDRRPGRASRTPRRIARRRARSSCSRRRWRWSSRRTASGSTRRSGQHPDGHERLRARVPEYEEAMIQATPCDASVRSRRSRRRRCSSPPRRPRTSRARRFLVDGGWTAR